MTDIESPQSFVTRQECEKVTWQNGFRQPLEESAGWAGFRSTTVPGTIHLAAMGAHGPWFLALDHAGVVEELDIPVIDMPGPGLVRFAFESLGPLYGAVQRIYQLSASLPDAPLQAFRAKIRNLPTSTEAERLVVQRIGQDIFRSSQIEYWQGQCPLTGITDPALLRASHIVPWMDCMNDEERLDVHNGLLLSALWDAAFDRGLVTFDDDGRPEFSRTLSDQALAQLHWEKPIPLSANHRKRLDWHRTNLFVDQTAA